MNKNISLFNSAIAFDVISKYHLFSAVAWCLLNRDKVNYINVFICKNNNNEYAIKEGEYQTLGLTIKIQKQNKQKMSLMSAALWLRMHFLIANQPIYILHHTYAKPLANLIDTSITENRPIYISFEEGVGTYGSATHFRNVGKREKIKNPILKYYSRKILKYFVSDKIAFLVNPNDVEKNAFRKSVEILSEKKSAQVAEIDKKPICLLLTGPYLDFGLLTEFDYVEVINNLKKSFADYEVIIKPHPIEIKSIKIYLELGVRIIESKISAEEIFEFNNISMVLSEKSGAALIANNVYGIRVAILNMSQILLDIKTGFGDREISRLYDNYQIIEINKKNNGT